MTKCKYITLKVWRFLISLATLELCSGHNILVVFPYPARSHGNLGDGLVQLLLKAGHQVTYITPFVQKTPQQNLTYIDVTDTNKAFGGNRDNTFGIEQLMTQKIKLEQHQIFHLMRTISELAFDNKNVQNFLEDSNQKFDVVVAEWMFNELYCGFAALFKCPYIWMFPFEPNFAATSLMDTPTNPAYAVNLELNIMPPFTFLKRVRNLWFQISYQLKYYYYYDDIEKAIYDRVFAPVLLKRHGTVVPYDTLRYNASLMLSYSHNSVGQSLSIPQSLIPVGGYHVDDNPPPLPGDLKNIMDNSKEGVIYFSMGSNLQSKSFPKYILQDLIKMFSEIKYTVLWKFEGDISGYSDNVHILKWAPQQSILAHPNCVLFITHGGLLSSIEAVNFGIPIIGIPVFYDQFSNVDKAVLRGFAKKVLLSNNFSKDLKAAIVDIVTDDRYAARAKELSFVYHDRPVKPGVAVVHWVQHVIATQGASHLRSPALLLPWYQKCYVDLLAVAILLLVCAGWTINKFVNKCSQSSVDFLRKKVI